jgi:hypothetical protein
MVAGLLASYVGILVLCAVVHPAFLLIFLPLGLLHGVIRWEGPETPEEATHRMSGRVV